MKTQEEPHTITRQTSLGRHLLLELYGCDASLLNQTNRVEEILNRVARSAGATIIESRFHHFTPHGVSGVVIISESHLTIHTWPEYNYAAVDVFTCDTSIPVEHVEEMLIMEFQAERHQSSMVLRGMEIKL